MSIGKRILLLRKNKGLSQAQLADSLGTSRQAVSKWESGKSTPDIEFAIKIGAFFHVSMDYLLLGKEDSDKESGINDPHEPPCTAVRYRHHRLIFGVITVLSVLLLILLPIFASMYCVLMRNIGPVYTDPLQYLQEWPLIGIKWMGVIGFLSGATGMIWTFIRTKND